jgi:hypothetical protein
MREYQKKLRENPRDKTVPPKDLSPDKITGYTFKGEPILLQKQRGRPLTGGVPRAMAQGIFPQEKYVEAATLFAATGSVEKVYKLTGIPEKTLRSWIHQKAFKDLLNEIREENDEKIDSRYCEIIESALEGLKDRLEGGDYQLDKRTGDLNRVPVRARDLAATTATIVTQRQLIRGKPTSRTEQVGDIKRLEMLAEQFIKMTQAKTLESKSIEVEYEEIEDVSQVGGGS